MKFFVMPPRATSWRFSKESFVASLHRQWSEIAIDTDGDTVHSVEFSLRRPAGLMTGSLNQAGQVVALEGPVSEVATFALWVRSIVDPEEPLIFCDEAYSADVRLEAGSRMEDLVRPFVAS